MNGFNPFPDAGSAGAAANDPLARAALPRNDLGNGERLRLVHGDDMAHVTGLGWGVFDSRRWDFEQGGKRALQKGMTLSDIITDEMEAKCGLEPSRDEIAAKMADDNIEMEEARKKIKAGRRASWRNYIKSAGSMPLIKRALEVVSSLSMVRVEALDANPLRLTLQNGTLDLSALPPGDAIDVTPEEIAQAFSPAFHREDMSTRIAGAAYDPSATCPKFEAFLETIMPDDIMRNYLQQLFGYCLSGLISEQAVFLFQGEGGNGKSMLVSTIADVLGDYATGTPIQSFLRDKNRSGSGPSPDIARLPGARMVRASEPRSGDVLDEGRIKEWSGGEAIQARKLGEDFFEFIPCGKLFLSFNRVPNIYSDDDGTWRRIQIVPFSVQIPPEKRRPFDAVQSEMRAEASGILNWMIGGWRMYRAAGRLIVPEPVALASQELRESLDTIGQFLTECCVKGNGERVAFKQLSAIYVKWCERQSGDKPLTAKKLAMILQNKGYRNARGTNKAAMRDGLRLRGVSEIGPDIGPETWGAWLDAADAPREPIANSGDGDSVEDAFG